MDRPKRRKYKDNPYFLECDKDSNKYYIIFKDSSNVINKVEVTFAIYDVFNCSELHDLKEMNEYDNHIEHLELTDESIYSRTKDNQIDLDDEIIKKTTYENLMDAINQLSDVQKDRIKKYYFDELNEYEIARQEGVSHQVVHKSIKAGIKKLKVLLKKLK